MIECGIKSLRVVGALVLFTSNCFAEYGISAVVSKGRSACQEIRIPHRWRIDPTYVADGRFTQDDDYRSGDDHLEFRESVKAEAELLVTAYRNSSPIPWERRTIRLYSLDHYAVQISGKPGGRKVSQAEWDSAGPMLEFRSPAEEGYNWGDAHLLTFHGQVIPRAGEHWYSDTAQLSGDGVYLSVNSWSGVDYTSSPDSGAPGRRSGRYFLDIFHVDTRSRKIAISASFHFVSPGEFISESFWINKHLFVLPMNEYNTKFLVCNPSRVQ